MGTELWQFAIVTAAGVAVVFLWILFVYLPAVPAKILPKNLLKKIVRTTTKAVLASSGP
jgi:hypothetical protein